MDCLEWSDDEDEMKKYLLKPHVQESEINEEAKSKEIEQSSTIDPNRRLDYKRSNFIGHVETNKKVISILSKADVNGKSFKIPTPNLPTDIIDILGKESIDLIWTLFLRYGSDESELLEVRYLKKISKDLVDNYNITLPFNEITALNDMDSDDYIEFSNVIRELSKLYYLTKSENDRKKLNKIKRLKCDCCALESCFQMNNNFETDLKLCYEAKNSDIETKLTVNERRCLQMIYRRKKYEMNGRIRLKHVCDILKEVKIPYEKHRIPKEFWYNHEQDYLKTEEDLFNLIVTIRSDCDEVDNSKDDILKYELPQWLREEFKRSEIMLYEHHFTLIDTDNGGSIDGDELFNLLTSFGSAISRDEAQKMLEEYDTDGGGTIDFCEFMVLVYKIQRGTIDLSSSDLAQFMIEAKAQLRIFEEIEETKSNTPKYCDIVNYGGSPVTCDCIITGPAQSPYEDGIFKFEITFYDGYPYRKPGVKFGTRIFSLNVISQLNGEGRLLHLGECWGSHWSIDRLLRHIVQLLKEPQVALLPNHLRYIYDHWEKELYVSLTDSEKLNFDCDKKQPTLSLEEKTIKPSFKEVYSHTISEDKTHADPEEKKTEKFDGITEKHSESKESKVDKQPLTIDSLSSDDVKERIKSLTRIEQLHLQVLFLFLTDRDKYNETATSVTAKFAKI